MLLKNRTKTKEMSGIKSAFRFCSEFTLGETTVIEQPLKNKTRFCYSPPVVIYITIASNVFSWL